jgi:hypothetical protein
MMAEYAIPLGIGSRLGSFSNMAFAQLFPIDAIDAHDGDLTF